MSGPKTTEYTLTAEQRQNLNAQNICDRNILACISRIKSLQDQLAIAMGGVQIYDDCGDAESIALTNRLQEKMNEIEILKKSLSQSFSQYSSYQRPAVIILTNEELSRKKAIYEQLKTIKISVAKLVDETGKCEAQSKQLKEQISSEIQENLEDVFNLSWDTQEVTDTVSMQDKIILLLNSLMSNNILPSPLYEKVTSAILKAKSINNDEFLKNFNAVTVKPLFDECNAFIKSFELYGKEFDELIAEYSVLCEQLHIEKKEFSITESGITDLKTEITKLESELLSSSEQEYVANCIDEVMADMGYTLIGSREVAKKSGKRFHNELYTFSEGTAVNIRYDSQGKIAMELGGIDDNDRMPNEDEANMLENEMITFCDKFTEFERRLAEKGVVCKNRISHLPPKAEYAQIINTLDYEMKKEVEKTEFSRKIVKTEGNRHING